MCCTVRACIKRVTAGMANVSSVKAISKAASIQRAFYVGPMHICTHKYVVLVCGIVVRACVAYMCVCVCMRMEIMCACTSHQ